MVRQRWRSLGQIHESRNQTRSMFSHAAVPFAECIGGDIYRIYFSSRDGENRSYTHSLTINIEYPTNVLDLDLKPVLSPGEFATFDEDGAMATWITQNGVDRNLYYVGWNNFPHKGIFRNSIGLAISRNNSPFQKISNGPILDRSIHDAGFTASCSVVKTETEWRMWYLSCLGWEIRDGKPRHRYHIKEAVSLDGVNWEATGKVAIDFGDKDEYAISRPSVIFNLDKWRMWYSYRGHSYKIGYAESLNGSDWNRMDYQINSADFRESWSDEMQEYPHVFMHENQLFMLYNGNGYGKTGFGIAVLENG